MNEANLACSFYSWFSINHEAVRTAALILVAAVGIAIALWRAWSARIQAQIAVTGLANRRFTSAVELFGHSTVSVRLGAIQALANLANLYRDEAADAVVKMFQSHLTYPSEFTAQPSDQRVVDYRAPDTLEIIRLVNSGRVRPSTGEFTIPDDAPFRMENGRVVPNRDHAQYKAWYSYVNSLFINSP